MGKKPSYRVPFDGKHMLSYSSVADPDVAEKGKPHYDMPTEWRELSEFSARVQINGTYRGRSAARIMLRNLDNGESYSFGLDALYESVKAFGAKAGGIITGVWTFRKQGANYTLWPVVPS